jgi:anti-sigma-K factor RskA
MAEELHSLVAPYALDALDETDEHTFEQHLALCERCRTDLAGLREAAAALAYAAPPAQPPPELKERILALARAERPNVVPIQRRRNWTAPLGIAAAAAAALAMGFGVWGATRSGGQDSFAQVLSRPGAKVIKMGGRGAVAVAPDGEAAIALRLGPAPAGKTYEAWVIRSNTARPAGLFRGGDNDVSVVRLTRHVPKRAVIAVTIERAGGVDRPTQKPFVASAEQT